jgi:hypothetical protein
VSGIGTITAQGPNGPVNFTFKVEVQPSGSSRDLSIRRVTSQEKGFVQFDGPQGETPVVFNGQVITKQVPATVPFPVGEYKILTIRDGRVVNEQTVEVKANGTSPITVQR